MGYIIDPEGHETRVLHTLIDFNEKDVLEVGCGDGRLTWRYAARARSVLALDPNAERVEQASASTPAALQPVVEFRVADIVQASLPAEAFDVVVLSWSL
jgi:ubiquinone/menaquinone biosynthesis C-methylase UbiE